MLPGFKRNTCSYGNCTKKVCNGDHFCTPCRDAQNVRDAADAASYLEAVKGVEK
jgi:hypothetical protein